MKLDKFLYLFFLLIVCLLLSTGCSKSSSKNEQGFPDKFEVEYFQVLGDSFFEGIKISKNNNDINIEQFLTYCSGIEPISRDRLGRIGKLKEMVNQPPKDKNGMDLRPVYRCGKIPLNEFKEFWKVFHNLNLSQSPERIDDPGGVRRDPYTEGAFRIRYTQDNERIDKNIYIIDQIREDEVPGRWVTQAIPPIVKAMVMILMQKKYLTSEIRGAQTREIIVPKLRELYNHKNDFAIDGTEALLWEGAIRNALMFLNEEIPDKQRDKK